MAVIAALSELIRLLEVLLVGLVLKEENPVPSVFVSLLELLPVFEDPVLSVLVEPLVLPLEEVVLEDPLV